MKCGKYQATYTRFSTRMTYMNLSAQWLIDFKGSLSSAACDYAEALIDELKQRGE